MCDIFNLEYSRKQGIIAWADQDIFESFSGPGMVDGERWKIYLGRRIELDPNDHDGFQFLEGLLEDILLYPDHDSDVQWQTYKESTGVWATRPGGCLLEIDESESELSDHEDLEPDDKIYEDDGDNIPANVYGHEDSIRLYDAALEFPFRSKNEPVIEVDEYETDEDEQDTLGSAEEDELEFESNPSWEISGRMPDTVYEPEDEEELGNGNSMILDSEAGSDFDSAEELSGDEDLGWKMDAWQNDRKLDGVYQA
jgi:hypothetical protein